MSNYPDEARRADAAYERDTRGPDFIDAPRETPAVPQNDVERLRSEIERTRAEMGRTIDAIQEKASPERLKARAVEKVRDRAAGVIEKIGSAAGSVGGMIHRAVRSRKPASKSGTDSPSQSGALKPLAEQVVVVFGASSGIGRITAREMAGRGAQVVVAARDREGLDSLVEEIKGAGGQASAFVADAADFNSVKATAAHAEATYGRLDTWVQVAAISVYAKAEETTPEEFRRVMEVNLLGTVHAAQAALPLLKREGRGAFIAVTSVEGMRALPFQAAYSASKHAVVAFLDSLRVELQHDGSPIRITNVMPASINTPFFGKARTKLGVKPTGAPPMYEPSVVAEVILFAAEHPTRDITAGGAAQALILVNKFSPALVDKMLLRGGFESQKTEEPKSEAAPDNLYDPLGGFDHVEGDFPERSKSASIGNWLETHRIARRVLFGGAILLALLWLRNVGRRD